MDAPRIRAQTAQLDSYRSPCGPREGSGGRILILFELDRSLVDGEKIP